MNSSEMDWKTYFEKCKASLKHELESKPELWKSWTEPQERYILVTIIKLTDEEYYRIFINSDSIDKLKNLWETVLSKMRFDSGCQHFIADIKDKKIIEFVSVCM